MPQCVCGGQRTTFRTCTSASTLLRRADLVSAVELCTPGQLAHELLGASPLSSHRSPGIRGVTYCILLWGLRIKLRSSILHG